MFKVVVICKDTGEKRIYENCHFLSENLPALQEKKNVLHGEWQTLNNLIQISFPTREWFHRFTYAIELFVSPVSIEKDWIRITTRNETLYAFKKTLSLSKKWTDITMYVKLYGGKVHGNNFDFEKTANASAFAKHFVCNYLA